MEYLKYFYVPASLWLLIPAAIYGRANKVKACTYIEKLAQKTAVVIFFLSFSSIFFVSIEEAQFFVAVSAISMFATLWRVAVNKLSRL